MNYESKLSQLFICFRTEQKMVVTFVSVLGHVIAFHVQDWTSAKADWYVTWEYGFDNASLWIATKSIEFLK